MPGTLAAGPVYGLAVATYLLPSIDGRLRVAGADCGGAVVAGAVVAGAVGVGVVGAATGVVAVPGLVVGSPLSAEAVLAAGSGVVAGCPAVGYDIGILGASGDPAAGLIPELS